MHEQSRAAVWCGRLLRFTALILGIVTLHTFGHPRAGHGADHTLFATVPRARRMAQPLRQAAAPPRTYRAAGPAGAVTRDAHAASAQPTDARADAPGGAMVPRSIRRAVLPVRAPAPPALPGAGAPTGRRETGARRAPCSGPPRSLGPIPRPPRPQLPARLPVLRV
ncbi:hypothetical protein [Streptomyces sp. NPDC054786]